MFLTIISSSLPDTGGVYACVGTNFVADGVEKTDVKSVSVSVSDEEPSCGVDEFQCQNKSACIPMSRKCDGIRHCTDGSDEATCPDSVSYDRNTKCVHLSVRDDSSSIICDTATKCTYSCVNPSMKFTSTMSGGFEVVSEMVVTCDPYTSQWSHMTDENPLGNFPSCRGRFILELTV